MTDPVELLRRLQVSLVSGYMPPDVAAWLGGGVEKYLNGQPLDAALDLKVAPGKPNPAAQIRLAERDELVRRAARGLDGSPWQQAGRLQLAISGAPQNGNQEKYIADIRRLGWELPTSQSQLYKILTGYRPQDTRQDVIDPCPCDGCSQRETCRQNGNECEAFRIWVDSESLHELRIS